MEIEEQRPASCNLHCLKRLLTCGCGNLERAVERGSASTVRSILDLEDFSTEELYKALISALIWKFPECLDALLKGGARRRKVFNRISPYHALFTFCTRGFSQYTSPKSNILETLRVLTTYSDLDIIFKEQNACYPLYTLIDRTFGDEDWYTATRQSTNMACLEILLQAGANPNFSEGGNAHLAYTVECRTCHRYHRYSSGLNGVFLSFQNMLQSFGCSWDHVQHSVELLRQMCRLLLQHGSNPNHISVHGTTPLHDLMKLWALRPYVIGERQLPLCQIQSILLSYGADPNKTTGSECHMVPVGNHMVGSTSGGGGKIMVPIYSYPVHYYSSVRIKYWQIPYLNLNLPNPDERWRALPTHLSHVHSSLLLFMDPTCAAEAGRRIIQCWHGLLGQGMPVEVFEETQDSVWRVLHEARALLFLSQLAVWKAIGRNFYAAETRRWMKINIPQTILRNLDNMFVCQCHN